MDEVERLMTKKIRTPRTDIFIPLRSRKSPDFVTQVDYTIPIKKLQIVVFVFFLYLWKNYLQKNKDKKGIHRIGRLRRGLKRSY